MPRFYKFFLNLQNHPTFHSVERLVNLVRGRRVLCWSIYIISLCLPRLILSSFRRSSPMLRSLVTLLATPTTRYRPWSSRPAHTAAAPLKKVGFLSLCLSLLNFMSAEIFLFQRDKSAKNIIIATLPESANLLHKTAKSAKSLSAALTARQT